MYADMILRVFFDHVYTYTPIHTNIEGQRDFDVRTTWQKRRLASQLIMLQSENIIVI